jgi:hypothetical protein
MPNHGVKDNKIILKYLTVDVKVFGADHGKTAPALQVGQGS